MPKNKNGSGSNPKQPTGVLLAALEALLSGEAKTQKEAAEIGGISPQNLSLALKKKHVKEFILERCNNQLKTVGVLSATANLQRLANSAESEYVQADVNKFILGVAGVRGTADGLRGGGGAGTGIQLNIVLSGQGSAQIGAQTVQSRVIDGQATDITAQITGGNSLAPAVSGEVEGGEGSGWGRRPEGRGGQKPRGQPSQEGLPRVISH